MCKTGRSFLEGGTRENLQPNLRTWSSCKAAIGADFRLFLNHIYITVFYLKLHFLQCENGLFIVFALEGKMLKVGLCRLWFRQQKFNFGEDWCSRILVEKGWLRFLELHCKIRNIYEYSQNRNCAATVPIPTFMFLCAIYIFPRSVCIFCCRKISGPIVGIYKSLTDTWMWKLGLRPRNSQKRNI